MAENNTKSTSASVLAYEGSAIQKGGRTRHTHGNFLYVGIHTTPSRSVSTAGQQEHDISSTFTSNLCNRLLLWEEHIYHVYAVDEFVDETAGKGLGGYGRTTQASMCHVVQDGSITRKMADQVRQPNQSVEQPETRRHGLGSLRPAPSLARHDLHSAKQPPVNTYIQHQTTPSNLPVHRRDSSFFRVPPFRCTISHLIHLILERLVGSWAKLVL